MTFGLMGIAKPFARRQGPPVNPNFNIKGCLPIALIAVFGLGSVIWWASTRNVQTPAGYVGYVTEGAIFGKSKFVETQTGPTSSGRKWLYDVVNVSVTPYTYSEDFNGPESVLSKDNLQISFRIHIVWKVKPEMVKEFVEQFSTIQGDEHSDTIVQVAYNNFLREPLRMMARNEVQQLDGLMVKDRIAPIGVSLMKQLEAKTKDTPFEVISVVVGNIQYPREVADSVSRKLAATQELERKKTEIEIAKQEASKRLVESEAIAKSMDIINQRLTPAYIQYEAIKAQKDMVNSPNHTTIYIPSGPMGVPIVSPTDPMTNQSQAAPGK
jgi:regulator of protease activity HflC (stomatin/prohibitin superfamily)